MTTLPIMAAIAVLVCEPTTKTVCSAGQCRQIIPSTWAEADAARATYSRCDKSGCDTYEAVFSQSGAFQTVEVTGRGVLAKIGPSREFVEAAALGTDVYVSYGQCREKR